MEYIYVDDLSPTNLIGSGKTAKCYRDGDKCIKIYKKGARRYFDIRDDILKKLVDVKSDYIITPDELIVNKNEMIVGYTSKYVDAKPIKKSKIEMPLKDLIEIYLVFKEEISKVSKEYNIHLGDVHEGNILFSNLFYLIDLDLCYIADIHHEPMNQSKVVSVIIDSLFRIYHRYLRFYDQKLEKSYYDIMTNYAFEAFNDFTNRLYEIYGEDVTVKEIYKKRGKILR